MTNLAIRDDVWRLPARHDAKPAERHDAVPAVRHDAVPAVRHDAVPAVRHDAVPAMRTLAQAIAEVLAGARPASQLCDVAAPDVVSMLARSAGRLRAVPGLPAMRPIVGSVHVREPLPGIAEGCALINLGVRYRTLALRLEMPKGRWQCTALSIG